VIKGGADGRVSFRITGHAIEEVITTRAGFCILHPASAAGLPCSVRHSDGSVEDTAFPDKIAQHQPLFDVSAITHQPAPGLRVTVEMAGDVFETEDQRNWTDASFKTYCRPLSKPYPYTLEKGSSFEQEMVVTVATPAGAKPSTPPSEAL